MGFFKKKQKYQSAEAQPECGHKYKDFPWYVDMAYSQYDASGTLRVYEPYVCIYCGNRMDKQLHRFEFKGSSDKFMKYCAKFMASHADQIEERVIIEDQINDMILVDREHLKYYELLRGGIVEPPKLTINN